MTLELPREIDALDERLRALEDAELAARLALNNPLLYPRPLELEPAPFVRGRRFGSIALAITVAASLVAGALLGPAIVSRGRPAPPVISTHTSSAHRVHPTADAPAGPIKAHAATVTPVHAQTAAPAEHPGAHPAAVPAPPTAHRAKTMPIGRRAAGETQSPSDSKVGNGQPGSQHASAAVPREVARTGDGAAPPRSSPRYETGTPAAANPAQAGQPDAGVNPHVTLTDANEVLPPSGGPKMPASGAAGGMIELPDAATPGSAITAHS